MFLDRLNQLHQDTIQIKILTRFFSELENIIQKCICKCKRPETAKASPRNKNKTEEDSQFQTSRHAIGQWLSKHSGIATETEKINGVQVLGRSPHMHCQLIFDKRIKNNPGKRLISSVNAVGRTG